MTRQQILKRLARLEELMLPKHDKDGIELISLVDLLRSAWKKDKQGYIKRAENPATTNTFYRLGASKFQAEDDAEAAAKARRLLHARK